MDEFTLISDLFLFGGASRGQIAPKNRMIFEIQNLKKKGKKANGQREQPTPHQIPHTHTHNLQHCQHICHINIRLSCDLTSML